MPAVERSSPKTIAKLDLACDHGAGFGRINVFHNIRGLMEAGSVQFGSILVPLDGSRLAAEAVSYGTTLARIFGIPMTLLRVVAPMDPSSRADREHQSLRSQAHGYLASFQQSLAAMGQQIETLVEEGDPAEVILRRVQEMERPLLILGSVGRTASSGQSGTGALGRVAEQLVRRWQGPLLLISKESPQPNP